MEHEKARLTCLKIEKFAKECNIDLRKDEEREGWYFVFCGSAVVYIYVLEVPINETSEAFVVFFSPVVTGARIDDELKTKLLKVNFTLPFGSFALTEDGVIVFKHAILGGPHMDKDEFYTALTFSATIADEYDNKIISTHGGFTALDLVSKNLLEQLGHEDIFKW